MNKEVPMHVEEFTHVLDFHVHLYMYPLALYMLYCCCKELSHDLDGWLLAVTENAIYLVSLKFTGAIYFF